MSINWTRTSGPITGSTVTLLDGRQGVETAPGFVLTALPGQRLVYDEAEGAYYIEYGVIDAPLSFPLFERMPRQPAKSTSMEYPPHAS